LIARLDGEMEQSYVAAEAALRGGDELKARGHLEARQEAKVRLAAAQADLPAAVERVRSMEASLAALAERARRVEEQISRSVVANRALRDDAILGSAELPPPEDPLEKRFRDLDKK
jgi:phage shock protein A